MQEEAHQVFVPESEKAKEMKKLQAEIEGLQRLIGEISIENNFLKKLAH